MADELLIGMAGAGGDGVISAGESLIRAAALEGYHAMLTKSFGPQIRGGESSFRLRIAANEVYAVSGTLDLAIALNWDDFLRFGAELPIDGQTTVIYEAELTTVPEAVSLAGVRVGQSQKHSSPRAVVGVARVCSRDASGRDTPQVRKEGT
jgi:2-oxoglutarate ferredoxin oxidoreductase subunit alpha